MTSPTTDARRIQDALTTCLGALRDVAASKLEPALDRRMLDLGERKEFLGPEEHAELLALVAFAQQRTREKLQAHLALQRLQAAFPDLAGAA